MWGKKSKKDKPENIAPEENYESAFGEIDRSYDQNYNQNFDGYVDQGYDQNGEYYDQNYDQGYDQNNNQNAGEYVDQGYDQGEMQEGQYAEQYYENATGQNFDAGQSSFYTQNESQPLDATQIAQQETDPNAIVFVPGQNGVPSNITPQGIENLVRLERLRRNGLIDDTVYANIFNKICNQFLS